MEKALNSVVVLIFGILCFCLGIALGFSAATNSFHDDCTKLGATLVNQAAFMCSPLQTEK